MTSIMDSFSKLDVYNDAVMMGFSDEEACILAEDESLQNYYDLMLDKVTAPEALQELREKFLLVLEIDRLEKLERVEDEIL